MVGKRIEIDVLTGAATEHDISTPDGVGQPQVLPQSITRRQCAAELFARGMISPTEAVAMVATATPPAAIEAALAALAEPEQTFARLDFAAGSYERGNPLLISLMSATGASPADIDALFRAAGAR